MIVTKFSSVTCIGLSLGLAACGGDNLTLPSEGEPASIAVVSGNNQTAPVNTQLPLPLQVEVKDSRGRPVSGIMVEFALAEGSEGGAVTPNAETNDSGFATASITLGTRVGQVTGQAWISEEIAAVFVAEAFSSDANTISLVSGQGQTGAVGTRLAAPLVVQVTDGFGNPIPDRAVNWSVSGGGSVSEEVTQTDDNGQTSVLRTLGNTAGPQTTLASADGLAGSPVTFTHTATAGNAARVLVISGNGQQAAPGTRLSQDLVVQVLDADNNPISGRAVAWVIGEGGGRVTPETSTTDGQGRATAQWTLGPAPGRNTLSAVVSGVGIGAFNATAGKASSSVTITSHQPEPSVPGQAVEVRVQVSGTGATPEGSVTVNGEAAAPCTITLAGGAGACSLTFNAEGNLRITASYSGDARFNGNTAEVNHRVEGANTAPTAAFTPPTNCVEDQPCQFTDESSDDGSIEGWNWSIGGEEFSRSEDPSHIFDSPGTFPVTLTVTDDDGATGSVTHDVNVTAANAAPTASFTHADCTAGVECQFTDTSTDDKQIVSWRWDFGDFTEPSGAQHPTHAYTVGAGFPYQVTLTVTDAEGESSSTTQTVTVQ